jgi:hypothetical protein
VSKTKTFIAFTMHSQLQDYHDISLINYILKARFTSFFMAEHCFKEPSSFHRQAAGFTRNVSLKVVVEWVTFLRRILEVPGSNLGKKIGYPD